tara:strand:+ start:1061 stop:1174 length:114 start_codon:yes stop_codon:yes gene_type:complete
MEILIFIAVNVVKPALVTLMVTSVIGAVAVMAAKGSK